jgi:hypothetical protein
MAGAEINIAFSQKIDVASSVGAHGIESLDLVACPAEINRADGDLGEFVPGIDAIGEDGKFARKAIIGKGFKSGDADVGASADFSTEGIKEDFEAGHDWDYAQHSANNRGEKALKEIASADWRRRMRRIVHTE